MPSVHMHNHYRYSNSRKKSGIALSTGALVDVEREIEHI